MKIFLKDDLKPEDEAVLQALYSRSAASVESHLEKLARTGSGKFMESYYVGYGHKSIGDCGTTTLFIEGVSLLAAKAIQDHPLYRGQETSTRYIDMAAQALCDPIETDASREILENWMRFYTGSRPAVEAHIRATNPKKAEDNQATYDKAINARVFDILRGYLPAGVTTNLSLHIDLRQLGDRLESLHHHPLDEVREVAHRIDELAREHYKHSTRKPAAPEPDPVAVWRRKVADSNYLRRTSIRASDWQNIEYLYGESAVHLDNETKAFLRARPPRCELPWWLAEEGLTQFQFLLDFGSFRDLQRHRNGVCRMPLLDGEFGFYPWYIDQLPPHLQDSAKALVTHQQLLISRLGAKDVYAQYYRPLGALVPCQISYGLPGLVYLLELRSGKMIHPTLRMKVHQMAEWVEANLGVPLHIDRDPSDWDVRRGSQDITER